MGTGAGCQLKTSIEEINKLIYIQKKKSIETFLSEEEEIRIFVADAPGLGHQANSIKIMFRLIDWGFKGDGKKIIIVYKENTSTHENLTAWEKLRILIPVLQETEPTGDYYVEINNTRVYFYNAKDKVFDTQINLAITGGVDNDQDLSTKKTLYSKCFLMLQPYEWDKVFEEGHKKAEVMDLLFFNTEKFILKDTIPKTCLEFKDQAYQYDLKSIEIWPPNPESFWESFEENNRTEAEIIIEINKLIENEVIELCPIYFAESLFDENLGAFSNMLGFIKCFKESNIEKKIIFLELADFSVTNSKLSQFFNKEFEKIGAYNGELWEQAYNKYFGNFESRIKIYCSGDRETLLSDLRNVDELKEINIASLGSVPINIFNYIFFKGTLPCIFEGASTASLILNFGKPYIRLESANTQYNENFYPKIIESPIPIFTNDILKAFGYNRNWAKLRLEDEEEFNPPKEKINEVLDEGSDTYKYYQELGNYYNNEQNGKLFLALDYALKKFEEENNNTHKRLKLEEL